MSSNTLASSLKQAVEMHKRYYGFKLDTGEFGDCRSDEKSVYQAEDGIHLGGINYDQPITPEDLVGVLDAYFTDSHAAALVRKLFPLTQKNIENLRILIDTDYNGLKAR